MNNKGFTLVELLVVIALLALSVGFIATNFNAINGTSEQIEERSIAKGIAEAAYVLIDNEKDNKNGANPLIYTGYCYDAKGYLLDIGYIPEDQGLLNKCDQNCMKGYHFIVTKTNGHKKVYVYHAAKSVCTNDTTRKNAAYTYGGE
jgi:prepilin-type N-terminal cleavage/methylation domain-containing protein